jgi:hypothetical protein
MRILCNVGIKGGLIVGITVLEALTSYWRSLKGLSFDRRIHHGELGTLLGLSSLY